MYLKKEGRTKKNQSSGLSTVFFMILSTLYHITSTNFGEASSKFSYNSRILRIYFKKSENHFDVIEMDPVRSHVLGYLLVRSLQSLIVEGKADKELVCRVCH